MFMGGVGEKHLSLCWLVIPTQMSGIIISNVLNSHYPSMILTTLIGVKCEQLGSNWWAIALIYQNLTQIHVEIPYW